MQFFSFFFFMKEAERGLWSNLHKGTPIYYTTTCGILQTSRSSWKNTTQLTKNYLPLAGEFFLMYTQVNHNIDVIFDGYASNVIAMHTAQQEGICYV